MPETRLTIDLSGKSIGLWTVVSKAPSRNKKVSWNCICHCGTVSVCRGRDLMLGKSRSCSRCAHKRKGTSAPRVGPEYNAWLDMQRRCHDSTRPNFHNYGGRGIKVCGRWRNSFEAFLEDMGKRPDSTGTGRSRFSIDRIDVDGDYEPGNCRWATWAIQANNRRTNHNLTVDGKTQTISQWAVERGTTFDMIRSRLRYGWSERDAVMRPPLWTRKRKQ